ncbi:hypothetical protein KP509_22G072200 [Ceratopteris richardii]|nr:hypothetical protein KP509_22G072200 [Ceratopteris richardii]
MDHLINSTMLGNSLVKMYTKCGAFTEAFEIFEELRSHDAISWNVLISGFCQSSLWEEVLVYFEHMKHEGFPPDAVTYSNILKACGNMQSMDKGKNVHVEISMQGLLGPNTLLGSALVDMYAKCGELKRARQIFNDLAAHDVISWTALIVGYCQHGQAKEALDCFEQMRQEGIYPDLVTYACVSKACGNLQATDHGRKVHAEAIRKGYRGDDLVLGNALVAMYAKCSKLRKALHLFDELQIRDTVSWSVLITEFCQNGYHAEAIKCYKKMKHDGLCLDSVSFSSLLKACGSLGAAQIGSEIYSDILERGLLQSDAVLGSAVVDMYAKCSGLEKAQHVFDELPIQNVVSWNALITGYCKHSSAEETLACYEQFKSKGLSTDAVTYACILNAFGTVGAAATGRDVHAEIVTKGLLEENPMLGSVLIDMYSKLGALAAAEYVFNKLLFHDVVSWTGLIEGYLRHGFSEDAVNCYEQMEHSGVFPDAVTFSSVLKACGNTGKTAKGQELHVEIARKGLLKTNKVLAKTLIDMYAKCGALQKSQEAFDGLSYKDVGAWGALIAGYCEHGHGPGALRCFEQMIRDGISPDPAIYTSILRSCGNVVVSKEHQTCFEFMSTNCGILTSAQHACMVACG